MNSPTNIPDRDHCYQIMCRMEMMAHIAVHSIVVAGVALALSDSLLLHGVALNRNLIRAAALLHDITKTQSIATGEIHSKTGEAYLTGEGFPEVGRIVGQHVELVRYETDAPATEAEIVNYADKRVLHDRIVSLEQRMAYILDRYGKAPERRQKLAAIGERTVALEAKLFQHLSFAPADVASMVEGPSLAKDLETYRHVCQQLAMRSASPGSCGPRG